MAFNGKAHTSQQLATLSFSTNIVSESVLVRLEGGNKLWKELDLLEFLIPEASAVTPDGGEATKVASEVRARLMRPYSIHTPSFGISFAAKSIFRSAQSAFIHWR